MSHMPLDVLGRDGVGMLSVENAKKRCSVS